MITQDKHKSITKLLHVVQCYQKKAGPGPLLSMEIGAIELIFLVEAM
jgi:hypothetical protein